MGLWRKIFFIILGTSTFLFFQNCGDFDAIDSYNQELASIPDEDKPFVNTKASEDVDRLTATLLQRLGVKTSVDSSAFIDVKTKIIQGDLKGAALRATKEHNFLNITVKDFAAKMSNREELTNVPLNDFSALFIGITRDDIDARELLTADYYYWAKGWDGLRLSERNDVVRSNRHFQELEDNFADYAALLERESSQKIFKPTSSPDIVNHEDAAGALTTRAFMLAHANAGTNRRLVEFSFSQFLCADIEQWSDTSLPGFYIGRDIGRSPTELFNNKCKGCHAPMDAMRPAFAHVDFIVDENGAFGYTAYKEITLNDPNESNFNLINVPVPEEEQLVPSKFRRVRSNFPDGHIVTNDSWENFTSDDLFQWRSEKSGSGLKSFGRMIASSHRFSQCMARRVFRTVCYQNLDFQNDQLLIDKLAYGFENSGYNLRDLFAEAVIQESCIGEVE